MYQVTQVYHTGDTGPSCHRSVKGGRIQGKMANKVTI